MTSPATKVLLVDDDPAMLRLLAKWVAVAGYEVSTACGGRQAQASIERDCPAILITDWEMPEFNGLDLCRWIRQQQLPNYVYTIFLTVRSSSGDMVQGLDCGADEFLHKPVNREELVARMRSGARIMQLERRLSQLANTDALTGLSTRRSLHEFLTRELARSHRHHVPLSCVMVDIDFFKRINDTHGHPAGDEVIRQMGRLLSENVRSSDIASRYGGEEFCVLLPETNERQAAQWAERVRQQVAQLRIPLADTTLSITASFGVAQRLVDTQTPEQLVEMADQALVVAKRSGRDRVLEFGMLRQASLMARGSDTADALRDVPARVVMSSLVAPLQEDDTAGSASSYFLRFRQGSAPVVNEAGQLVGILSDKDVMAIMLGHDWWSLPIKEVMKRNVVCYEEETPALAIHEFLCRAAIRGVVIVRQGRPTGLITRGSLLRYFMNEQAVRGGGDLDMDVTAAAALSARIQADRPCDRISRTVRVLQDEVADLDRRLQGRVDDLVPEVVGGASRIQELTTDLLALTRDVHERPVASLPVPSPATMPECTAT